MQNSSMDTELPPELPPFQIQPASLFGDSAQTEALGRNYTFRFKGNAAEYFGIWIVNILLTIITIGFYAPWAKVRRLRYFYGNTWVFQRRFDFTGLPSKILVGRIIALVIYAAFSFAIKYSWEAFLAGFVLVFLAVPWLIRSTLRFRARNSKFSNSRFYFSGTNKSAYWCFLKCIAVFVFTLGLLGPVAVWLYKRECFNHLYIGQLKFSLNASWTDYMRAIYMPLFLFLGCFTVLAVVMTLLYGSLDSLNASSYFFIISAMYLLGYMFIWPLTAARIFMTSWNNTTLSRSQFQTNCNQWRYAWIVLSNWIAKIISLGLLTPWAVVRLYKYQVESLRLMLVDDPDLLQNQMQQDHNAIAEELSDIFDLDISL